ncbi:MAG: translation initiation factor IF-2 subunit beta [Nanoarchaeota archaeon]|nr:translation initiation factor IF-2 subunit beta [Nanoarchaeota archaeon]MBU4352355.1 translation initiation factor IF-2 subunit beta [Nanoarchaeota archaeon]MBU4456266.1 translation initiation factor IF-2 subunit beta [Nanoarchaeota archaeon]MCG2720381.1 translation initiation factor IF-2 subunit beta [Nanoarchaeota archaeon]
MAELKYEELLKKANKELPQEKLKAARFEIPKVKGHVQGNKTIISNFGDIVATFMREPGHLLKYLQRELATPASIDGPRLILGRKLSSAFINSKIEQFANTFVLCPECKRPDTQLKKDGPVLIMQCMACGAKHPVKAKI